MISLIMAKFVYRCVNPACSKYFQEVSHITSGNYICFSCKQHLSFVRTEPTTTGENITSGIIGGAIIGGILGGAPGAIIGGVIGSIVGSSISEKEKRKRFFEGY